MFKISGLSWLRFLATALFVVVSTPSYVYAGDLMNKDFLKNQAKLADPEIGVLQAKITQYNTVGAPSKNQFLLNTVANGIFTATYYISNIAVLRGLGTGAGAMFYAPFAFNYHHGKKAYKEFQQSQQTLNAKLAGIDQHVEQLYPELKTGSPTARQTLVQLTSEAAVSEVESSFSPQDAHNKPSTVQQVPNQTMGLLMADQAK